MPLRKLRIDAENVLQQNGTGMESGQQKTSNDQTSREWVQAVSHDLQVHQIELEMQNDQLRRMQTELDAARAKYFDLYDLAPVGYCTVSLQGIILESNLTAASMLGVARGLLAGQALSRFIQQDDQDIFYVHRKQLLEASTTLSCELRIRGKGDDPVWFQVNSSLAEEDGRQVMRIVLSDITRMKAAESSRLISEQRFASAITATQDGIWDWDINDGHVYYSPQWCRLLGYTPNEVAPDVNFFYSALHPEDIFIVKTAIEEHFAGRTEEKHGEIRLRTRTGSYRWFLDRGKVVEHDQQGKPTRMVGAITDITDRKHAEAELERRERELRIITDTIPGPVARVDRDLRYTFINKYWEKMFGISRGELVGRRMSDTPERNLFPQAESYVRQALTGQPTSVEGLIENIDGENRHNLVRFHPERDLSGQIIGVVVVGLDVTEQKMAEKTRKEAIDRLHKISSRLPGFVYQFRLRADGTTCMPYASDGIQELFHVSPEAVREDGSQMFARVHPDDYDQLIASIQQSADKLTQWKGEFRYHYEDGASRWISGDSLPEREEDGSTLWHGFMSDITARKKSEKEHKSLEEQLRQSQKMEAIGTLAGGIAHDFNNILATILGHAEIAESAADGNQDTHNHFREIIKAGSRARDLVQQILSFSRQQPTALKPVSLVTIVEEAVRLLRATLPGRLQLTFNYDQNLPQVLADSTQIEHLVINLVTNAMHALPEGAGNIQVGRRLADNARKIHLAENCKDFLTSQHLEMPVILSVSDNGTGMDTTTLERIFEPFFTTKAVGRGTGLGLSVVHGIVKNHGGAILVQSQPEQGTTFYVCLPPALPSQTTTRTSTAGSESHEGLSIKKTARIAPDPCLAEFHVICIDDDASVLSLIELLLRRQGFRVTTFLQPTAALEVIRANPADVHLVVTDYNMPELAGVDVARAVKQIRKDLPIAITSGYIDEELRADAEQACAQALVSKPFVSFEFTKTIRQLILGNSNQSQPQQ